MGSIITADVANLLSPGIKKIYAIMAQEQPDYLPKLFNVGTTTLLDTPHDTYGATGGLHKWTGTVQYGDFKHLYKKTYTQEKYSNGLQIEERVIRYDLYHEIERRCRNLAIETNRSIQEFGIRMFNHAFDTSFTDDDGNTITSTGPDGVALCTSSHPTSPSDATAKPNYNTLSLTATNVSTTRLNMAKFTDDKGKQIGVVMDTILVGLDNEEAAWEVIKSVGKVDTADNNRNFHEGRYNLLVHPMLSVPDFPNSWFGIDSKLQKLYSNWLWGRPPELENDTDFDTEVLKYKLVCEFAYGWDYYAWIYGNKVA
ncbi:MAG: Mu-like prophage major head subunit gpT family protein [Pseudomonadota bacterium]